MSKNPKAPILLFPNPLRCCTPPTCSCGAPHAALPLLKPSQRHHHAGKESVSAAAATTVTWLNLRPFAHSHPRPVCSISNVCSGGLWLCRGDRAFCSVECRCRQIFMDEESWRSDQCSLSAATASAADAGAQSERGRPGRAARKGRVVAGGFA
ncbi:hypothetical protein B296_00046712 [Ensete ventricosum]|uniref:FLZ-type domain-containing protein n=1 Tax=Ensete ventricosum TaxID=4639 RepID=A0A426Z2U6_ENSVE|nr:hypothetical protein B296_00046712 [Ensete ventricosum]